MPIYALLFAVLIFIGFLSMQTVDARKAETDRAETVAIVGNMAVYRTYVAEYARANPAVTGSVDDADLGLPAWYRRNNNVTNYVSGGLGYVFYSGIARPQAAELLLQESGQSMLVGLKQGGFLYHPSAGSTAIPLPAAIPEGALVYLGA